MDHHEKLSPQPNINPNESSSSPKAPTVVLQSEHGSSSEEEFTQGHNSSAPRMILMRGTDGQAVPPLHSPSFNSRGSHDHVSDAQSGGTLKKEDSVELLSTDPPIQAGVLSAALVDVAVRAALAGIGQSIGGDSRDISPDINRDFEDEMSIDNSESRESGCKEVGVASPLSLNGYTSNCTDQKKPARRKRGTPQLKPGQTAGRWTQDEHQAFLRGLKIYGREWKKVAEAIPTRTSAQIRSHAQKYFAKMARDESQLLIPPLQQQEQQPPEPSVLNSSLLPLPQDDQTDMQSLPSSVQATAERILANPEAAQQEVADTIRALRERYRQLQISLEQQQQPSAGHRPSRHVSGRIVEEDDEDGDLGDRMEMPFKPLSPSSRKRRTLEDCETSSVASSVSASLASREFGDEEWIALHVLGDSLPRASSATDLTSSNSNGSNQDERKRNDDSSRSESSSAGSKRSREE